MTQHGGIIGISRPQTKSLEEFDLRKIRFGQVREAATIAAAVSVEPS